MNSAGHLTAAKCRWRHSAAWSALEQQRHRPACQRRDDQQQREGHQPGGAPQADQQRKSDADESDVSDERDGGHGDLLESVHLSRP
jgi:hypothetical protein